jgi:hypothetical protein
MRLFPMHAKYTVDNWRWLLGQCGFNILAVDALHGRFQMFLLGH